MPVFRFILKLDNAVKLLDRDLYSRGESARRSVAKARPGGNDLERLR
jgi:hypothetical protein